MKVSPVPTGAASFHHALSRKVRLNFSAPRLPGETALSGQNVCPSLHQGGDPVPPAGAAQKESLESRSPWRHLAQSSTLARERVRYLSHPLRHTTKQKPNPSGRLQALMAACCEYGPQARSGPVPWLAGQTRRWNCSGVSTDRPKPAHRKVSATCHAEDNGLSVLIDVTIGDFAASGGAS